MRIPPSLLEQCFAHGARCYPEEACGLLSGPADPADALTGFHPFENQLRVLHAKDPRRYPRSAREGYVLDPLAFLKLEQALRAEGKRVKAIYHTHPDVGAYFSEEDRRQAVWNGTPLYPGIVYLVLGIREQRPDGAVLAVFDPGQGDFRVQPLAGPPAG